MILKVDAITRWHGAELVLNGVSFVLNAGERVGLVGENGVGKSTLLGIVAGELSADGGEVAMPRGVDVGYLPQATFGARDGGLAVRSGTAEARGALAPGQTVDGWLREAPGALGERLDELAAEMRRLEAAMASGEGDDESVLAAYGEATERFETLGGYDVDHRIDQALDGLGLGGLPRDREVATLSGGEKMRLALAGLLLRQPELLLLDEPTNHLDFAALDWLEGYLRQQRGAVLVVSHDRRFLNRVVGRILEIPAHSREVQEYVGDYDAYLAAKTRERRKWEETYQQQQEQIAELERARGTTAHEVGKPWRAWDNDKFARGFFGGRKDASVAARVRAVEERLRRIEAEAIPRPPERLRIDPAFDPEALEGDAPLEAEELRKAYGGRNVLDGVSLALAPRSRIVLVGPNGAGKTTLLRILAGLLTPDGGSVRPAPGVTVGYLDQEPTLDGEQSVLEAYAEGLVGYEEEHVAGLARYGLFGPEDTRKPVGQLSVGQRRKLQIARLVASRANVLLLDEPTNHIHFDVLEELERALGAFPGPVVAVSHDRWFIERFGGELWELRDGKLGPFAANAST
ncbi:MAG TPA: ABC-F family ATP-binding cassette domain-containing protein [Chloroflexota bacterium]